MSILIPAYKPSDGLIDFIHELQDARPGVAIVVVDDGSGALYADRFDAAEAAGAAVIRFPENRGKGAALRAGFAYLELHHADEAVVCADADGQHRVSDTLKVLDRVGAAPRQIVLGVREFDKDVPLRSRFGNSLTRVLFAAATRRWLIDTQTGLRAFSPDLLGWLQSIDGDRYEYELRQLLAAARERIPYQTETIETVYLDDNSSSHFRPVADSVRIYLPLLGFAFSSLAAFAIDTLVLLVAFAMTSSLLTSVVMARVVSSSVNFAMNRKLLAPAEGGGPLLRAAVNYFGLVIAILAANYALMAVLTTGGLPLLVAKLITEVALFFVSYAIQRHIIFRKSENAGERTVNSQLRLSKAPLGASMINTAHTR